MAHKQHGSRSGADVPSPKADTSRRVRRLLLHRRRPLPAASDVRDRRRVGAILTLWALAVSSLLGVATAQPSLTFEKAGAGEGVWTGTVEGSFTGSTVVVLIAADRSTPVWAVDLYWIVVAEDPASSFVARLQGTLDTATGAVETSGTVVDGRWQGAQVVQAGHMVDEATSAFAGTIEVLPAGASADDYPWSLANRGASRARASVITVDPVQGYPWAESDPPAVGAATD